MKERVVSIHASKQKRTRRERENGAGQKDM